MVLEFLLGDSIWVYFIIFFGKLAEVAVSTLRLVLINRGERGIGSFIAFFDVLLWLFITGSVLSGFGRNFGKFVVFALAVAVGNYLGSWLESKFAFGMSSVQVILNDGEQVSALLDRLRCACFAVTEIDGRGKDGNRKLLIVHLRRKRIMEAVKIIESVSSHYVVAIHDVQAIRGGYLKK